MVIREKVIEIFADVMMFPREKIRDNFTSIEMEDWDSLGHLSLIQRLDDVFNNISSRQKQLASAQTVGEVINIVISDQQK